MDFDLAIIGTGTAAMVTAMRVRREGWSVAVIDEKPFGGTCALRGCDPKRMLMAGAEAVAAQRRMHGRGVSGEARIDWAELMAFKRSFTGPVPQKHEQRYGDKGIATLHGSARFTGPNRLRVGEASVTARHIVIASGARPAPLGIAGEEHLADSEAFLALDRLPARIVLVGGGYIAAEFSHLAARAGAQVTIVQRGARLLTAFEPEPVGWLMPSFEQAGIRVMTNAQVNAVTRRNGEYQVHASGKNGDTSLPADLVVHAAGRIPALERLEPEAAGMRIENGRLRLNRFLQNAENPAIYSAGDAASNGPPLTPVSSHDAKVVAANLVKGNHAVPDYRGVPSVAFTIPPIARAGLGEAEARAAGHRFAVHSEATPNWFTARRLAEPVYGHKVLVEEETGNILGAHIVGPHAEETINLFALAIRHGLTADDLATTMFAYPTGASDIGYMVSP